MKTITVCDVPFDIYDGSVGCSVSGGCDSAILLYTLMLHCQGPITCYTCSSAQKNFAAPHHAYDVITRCVQLTGRLDTQHVVYYVTEQTKSTLITPLARAMAARQHTVMYLGSTALPPDSESQYFKLSSGLYDIRNPNVIRDTYAGATRQYYSPMFNQNKKKIRELYEHYGLLETLYPITRSCESLTLTRGHCGACWWCEERMWAFGRYN
jgi:7-cyano-7-deazaguanine synthase in queuosine biosynthesis